MPVRARQIATLPAQQRSQREVRLRAFGRRGQHALVLLRGALVHAQAHVQATQDEARALVARMAA